MTSRTGIVGLALLLLVPAVGCDEDSQDGVGSEVATSAVSGSLSVSAGSQLGLHIPTLAPHPRFLDKMWEAINPIGKAAAATWTCTGGTLSPAFDGPAGDPYTFTPVSCSITWLNGKTSSSDWSSTFTLNYTGSYCDSQHPGIDIQGDSCAITRTTAAGGNTRTLTGPDGNTYAVTHDTNGAGTGWDTSVTPAPNNNGVVLGCGSGGCNTGLTLTINGSHLTGTLNGGTYWNHTVTTGSEGLSVTVAGTALSPTYVAAGAVTVQHNLAKFTSTSTFDAVTYDGSCCFPKAGTVTTTYTGGTLNGKSEALTFSSACGEATLVTATGATESITLLNCI